MTTRHGSLLATRSLSFLVVTGALAAAACDPSTEGALGNGSFRAVECASADCLRDASFATGSRSRLVFHPFEAREVTAVAATDPGVMRIDQVVDKNGDTFFDVTAVAIGSTELVIGDAGGVVDRLAVTVSDVAMAEIVVQEKMIAGGTAWMVGTKRGVDGRPAIGRGGYVPSAPAGIAVVPAPLEDVADLVSADFYLMGDAPGAYVVSADHAPAGWTAHVEVIAAADVTGMHLSTEGFRPDDANGGFVARVDALARVASGELIAGLPCVWTSTRPVTFTPWIGGVLVTSPAADPVDIACRLDARALGTLRITPDPNA